MTGWKSVASIVLVLAIGARLLFPWAIGRIDLMDYAFMPSPDNLLMISILLDYKQTHSQVRHVSSDNSTLLLMVCRSSKVPVDLVKKLLAIFPEATRLRGGLFQTTPLAMVAERGGSIEVAQVLIDANPESLFYKDGRGRIPEQIAQEYQHDELAEFLHSIGEQCLEYDDID